MCSGAQSQHMIKVIQDWWDSLSDIKKPVHCQDRIKNVPWSKKRAQGKILIQVVQCTNQTRPIQFHFKGKGVAGNSTINGPGKLKFANFSLDEGQIDETMCFKTAQVNDGKVVDVIGTFVNGTINGHSKIKFDNGWSVIGRFVKGAPHGFARYFNEEGELFTVGYFQNGLAHGLAWYKPRKMDLFVFKNWDATLRSNDRALMIVNGTHVLDGLNYDYISFYDDLHNATITDFLKTEDCMLDQIKWEVGNQLDYRYLPGSNTNELAKVPIKFTPNKFCNPNDSRPTRERLFEWNQHISSKSFHRIVLEHKRTANPPSRKDPMVIVVDPEIKPWPKPRDLFNVTWFGMPNITVKLRDGGGLDINGRFHGFASLDVISAHTPLIPKVTGFNFSLITILGFFHHGIPHGLVYMDTTDGRSLSGWIEDNVIHGPIYVGGEVPILPITVPMNEIMHYVKPGLGMLGRFESGKPIGPIWIGMFGGGRLYGELNADHEFTGTNLTFIYADMETALHGQFEDKKMISTQEVEILEDGCDENGMKTITKWSKPSGPTFYYKASTNESFGAGPPNVADPFERKWVELRNSTLLGSGQGLFLKQKPLGDHYISFYNGFMYDQKQAKIYREWCTQNTTKSDDERRHCKKYSLGISYTNVVINIPPEYDTPDVFHPTLAHKINHHFTKNNTYFSDIEHPRWGMIQSVRMSNYRTVLPDKELFGYYGYSEADFPEDFPWYHELRRQMEREVRLEKEAAAKKAAITSKPKP
eukprot:TCALIF_00747-PA protein Name:"Similar to setd7 Histone-lysine N-methyltransferase SETD7 (Danio rerio)" AED:0.33 eAED:0.33 QI:70/0.5/0.33/0.66/1/1/3/69/754